MIREIDATVEAVAEKLRTLKLNRHTIVFVTLDNGSALSTDATVSTRTAACGAKATLYEGGIRVPLVVWGPGQRPRGSGGRIPRRRHGIFCPRFWNWRGLRPPTASSPGYR